MLWIVALATMVHPLEEWATGWFPWANSTLGIDMPRWLFVVANCVLAIAAVAAARVGWRRPRLALIIPAATLVNAVVWHALPSIMQGRIAPGLYSALLLYVPFSTAAFVQAARTGVRPSDVTTAATVGGAIGLGVPLLARLV